MILREVPDLPPRPLSAANAAFRRWFYARWRRENAVLCTRTCAAEYPPYQQELSIKMAWNGAERFDLGRRAVSVDDDHYLILNGGQVYGSQIAERHPVGGLCVFFRPGMAAEVAGALRQTPAGLLDNAAAPAHRGFLFSEHLRPHDRRVTPHLLRLREGIDAGSDDEDWLEEQLQQLLTSMIGAEPGVRSRSAPLADASRSARDELQRRLDCAADFMLSSYAQPLRLDDVAAAARLSKFHLVRLFRCTRGMTPIAFLARRRAQVARRLIAGSGLPLEDIAAQTGFASRVSMFRQLRKHFGAGGRALRGGATAKPE